MQHKFIEFIESLGIHFNTEADPVYFFAWSVLLICSVCLLCFINILIYMISIYLASHEKTLKYVSNKPLLVKILNYYKSMRFIYIGIESCTLIYALVMLILLSLKIILVFSQL